MDKAVYFLNRSKETLDLESKLVLLNNAYNGLAENSFDGLKPSYLVVSMGKEEFQALISACVNDSDVDSKCSPAQYNLAALCKLLEDEISLYLQNS